MANIEPFTDTATNLDSFSSFALTYIYLGCSRDKWIYWRITLDLVKKIANHINFEVITLCLRVVVR